MLTKEFILKKPKTMETKIEKNYVVSIVLQHKNNQLNQITSRARTSLKTMFCFQVFAPSKVEKQKAIFLSQMQRRREIKSELKEIHSELNKMYLKR